MGTVGGTIFGATYVLYEGGGIALLIISLVTSIAVYLGLSLVYLCWVVVSATLKRSMWLDSYRPVLLIGLGSSLALATFVDGSYQFWDRPFAAGSWIRFFFIIVSAWAALFCHLIRDQAIHSGPRRAVVKWTLGLTFAFTLLSFWDAGHGRTEYLLRKAVTERPRDVGAWMDLGWHYKSEGERLESESGDDSSPPDPGPLYREALDCLNQAVSLGADGFNVHLARAQLADALGDKKRATVYGRNALAVALSSSGRPASPKNDDIAWLRDMLARSNSTESEDNANESSRRHVQMERR